MPGRANPLKRDEKVIQHFLGRWKVEDAHYNNYDDDAISDDEETSGEKIFIEDIKGVQLTLDEQYDLTWHIPSGKRDVPLFTTNAFDVDENDLELLGATDGASYVFEIVPLEETLIHLRCPASSTVMLILVLKKINEESDAFSLYDALDQGYFTDLTVRSSNGESFPVHRAVLSAVCPGIKYRDWEMALSSLSSKALKASLHFIYTSTLPSLTEDVAREVLVMAERNDKMSYLKDLCGVHIESYILKKKLLELVDSVLHSFDVARQLIEATDMSDPPKTLYAIKQLAREASIAITRLALLSQLYTTNKQKMTKQEKREVLEYVQARVVVCLDHGKELLELVLAKWDGLSLDQKQEAAAYIIPEVERIWDLMNTHAAEIHEAVAKISKKNKTLSTTGIPDLSWKASAALQFSTKLKDVKRLKKMNQEFENFVSVGKNKRQWFVELTEEEKADRILRVIMELTHDGEEIVGKLEGVKKKILIANALDWNSYKLAISISCSYMTWSLNKLLHLKTSFKPLVKSACKFIGSNDVNAILAYLSILEPEDLHTASDDPQPHCAPIVPPLLSLGKHSLFQVNQLAVGCCNLLESQDMCDMHFVIVDPTTPISTDDGNHGNTEHPLAKDPGNNGRGTVIKAHRVVLAARSEWFRRALQSGMIEDRDRRITVQDIEESLFRTFLEYLYGKPLGFTDMTIEELIELLAVADRYETLSLRRLCEDQLVSRITDVNVFQLLIHAEQFSARKLREATLGHVVANPNVLMTQIDAYSDLPSDLKQEVRQIMSGTQDISQFSRNKPSTVPVQQFDDLPNIPTAMMDPVNILSVVADDTAITSAIQSLRAVVGVEPTDDELKAHLLAADMDINRAVNFYFGIEA